MKTACYIGLGLVAVVGVAWCVAMAFAFRNATAMGGRRE